MRLRIVIEPTKGDDSVVGRNRHYDIPIETETEGIRLMQLLGRLGNDISKEWMLIEAKD